MGDTLELMLLDDFQQPPTVVEKFLEFTTTVFPGMFENGGEFLRQGVEADYRHAPDLYQALTIFSKKRFPDGMGSDLLRLAPKSDRHSDEWLQHSYLYLDHAGATRTAYSVIGNKLLAFQSVELDHRRNPLEPNHFQSVALTLGRAVGFDRGDVLVLRKDQEGKLIEVKDTHKLVGEEELDALLGLYAPKNR